MKTPRELLFEQHRTAESKLDAVRQKALNIVADDKQPCRQKTKVFNPAAIPLWIWRELIPAYPRIWAGLAAAWVVIFALAFASRDTSPTIAKASPPPSPEMLVALQNQKRLLAEMLMDNAKAGDTDRPKPTRPSPHSERMMPVITT
jgi:hypothetical protein